MKKYFKINVDMHGTMPDCWKVGQIDAQLRANNKIYEA